MTLEIVKSYFHPEHPNDFVVVETKRDGKILKERIFIDQKNKLISISLKEKPTGIIIDPEISLLYKGALKQIN